MTLYSIVLFVHVTAVLVLSATLSFEVLSLFHLRRAITQAEAGPWIEPVPKLPLFTMGSVLIILLTGIYLVVPSASGRAWPKVAVAALFLIGPLGAMTARRMRTIRRTYTPQKAMNLEMLGRLRDPFLKISLGVRIGVFQGIFLLVNAKPRLWESIGIVGGYAALGLMLSFLVSRRSTASAVSTADLAE
jgi:hypothetical protein